MIVQKPRHAAEPKGVFSLRSPARPNPVGLHVAKLVGLDIGSGRIELDAIDVLDGTPVIDLKPISLHRRLCRCDHCRAEGQP